MRQPCLTLDMLFKFSGFLLLLLLFFFNLFFADLSLIAVVTTGYRISIAWVISNGLHLERLI